MHRRVRTRVLSISVAALALSAVVVGGPATPASAAVGSMTLSNWSLPSDLRFGIGFDGVNTAGFSPGGYEAYYEWSPDGPSAQCAQQGFPLTPGNPTFQPSTTIAPGFSMSELRMEIYSFPRSGRCPYSHSAGDGAVVVRIPGDRSNHNLGAITVPRDGEPGTGRLTGQILAHDAIPDGRVKVDIFQVEGARTTSTGYRLDSFSSGPSIGGSYTTGPLWNGEFIAFVTDTVTGNQALGMIGVNGVTDFAIDLDVPCFGIDNCQFTGSVTPVPGGFHPVGPNRVLDTRKGIGIASAVQPGDGRNSDPNNFKRYDSLVNHELDVTGVGGVPAAGVSAVLLNVTATGSPFGGIAKLFPKPPNTLWYDDQSSFAATNPGGNLLVWGPNEDSANQVLVPVGVGGRIRIESYSGGSVDLIADVVGWFDSSQPGQNGSRLTAVTPERFLDTRLGIGSPRQPFGTDEARNLQVAGRGRIPADANAVVGTVTGVGPATQTFVTVWPKGTPRTETSVVNVAPGSIRPNLATVGVGADRSWSFYNERGPHDVLFDAVGFFSPSTGGKVSTVVSAPTLLDTKAGIGGPRQAFGQGTERSLQVSGAAGLPGGITAVYLSVTVADATTSSYLTIWNGGTRPETSNLNWGPGGGRSNLVLVPVAADGTIKLFNALGDVHVVAAAVAYVR